MQSRPDIARCVGNQNRSVGQRSAERMMRPCGESCYEPQIARSNLFV